MTAAPDFIGRLPVLILGGTSEASILQRRLADDARFSVTLSLAGRTSAPAKSAVSTRVGGFGGPQGLVAWMTEHRIALVCDATHPFAARISRNAATACEQAGVPLLAIRRPAWQPLEGDAWTDVEDMTAAAAALGATPRRVVLTIGRQELAAFATAPQHAYLARTIEPVGDIVSLPSLVVTSARGPFALQDEIAFLEDARAEVLVTKNSGGEATYAKIAAARMLGLPVIMVRRPHVPDVPSVPDAEQALRWLNGASPSLRAQRSSPE
jgi:precorrin-6A/cobalt-precorrin-6A reductase